MTDRTQDSRERLSGLFFDIHNGLPREGPGDSESTKRAFGLLPALSTGLTLDVGCGPGKQTIDLANVSRGSIVALDIHRPYLDELRSRSVAAGTSNRVRLVRASMLNMPFANNSLDVIWAEGSIYVIGFEQGLSGWRRLLKKDGCIAATHLSWLTPNVPDEPRDFWARHYPPMTTVAENVDIADRCGFESIGHFTLPEFAWWEDYYHPMEERLLRLTEKHCGDQDAISMIESSHEQIHLYRRFSDYYGYVFYVFRKR